jgi:uncharacterized membrane protein
LTAIASTTTALSGGTGTPEDPARSPRRWPHVLGVGFITSVYAALYSAYLLTLHSTLKDGLADVGEYDQAISGYAHFMGPHSPFVGLSATSSAGALQLSDHFTPLLALMAPGYWIYDGPQTLLVETAILGALPIIPLWLFTRRAVGANRPGWPATLTAYLVVIGYGVTWPIQMALWFEFHEVFLALPIMMWMLERAQAGKLRQAALVSLLLLGVKDDMGFVVAAFGVYLATKDVTLRRWAGLARRTARDWKAPLRAARSGHRPLFLAMVPVGFAMVALVNRVLLPAFGGSSDRNFTYNEFGANTGQALSAMAGDPWRVWTTMFDSPLKEQTLSMLMWPVLFLCLLSPISLLGIPLLMERFLSVNLLYWVMPYHYNAFLVPIVFCAGVDGATRLAGWLTGVPRLSLSDRAKHWTRAGLLTAFGAYIAIYAWSTAFRYPMHHMTDSAFWDTGTSDIVSAKVAAAHVPSGVLVAAATQVGPQLLHRDKVIMWSFPGDRDYPQTPWVLADVQRASYPFASVAAQQADVQARIAKGYKVVFEDDGWVVLHKG